MKYSCLFVCLILSFFMGAQEFEGSWKLVEENGEPVQNREIVRIYVDNYFSEAAKKSENNEFLYTLGGEFSDATYSEKIDFNSKNPELIGETYKPDVEFSSSENTLTLKYAEKEQVWEKISSERNALTGNWVITGRKRDGKINKMTPGDRRTVKILAGDRFQWIAFNSATREFFGTGGGDYTAENGKYVEHIDLFSRDNNRVGAQLEFNFEVKDGKWHHSGKSSKGDPIYEIWSAYAEAYQQN
ncbi:hypothetical protein [Gramella sp. AN32]|uniref:Membrane or secreted protein n=1 Tax=Christiangramia antarctica TaxID=2058158 RepID=A0ABW5X277_9FLAO|nr:hypothetical protein [Gramella sp. AN32]MCM4155173.1 hypothetical protein [Gramella sp. AN32]